MSIAILLYICVFIASDSLQPHGLPLAKLFCPWDFPGKNTGVDCRFLFHGIFPTQESNPNLLCLLHWQADFFFFLITAPPRKPFVYMPISNPSLCISMVICLYLYLYFGKGNDNPLQYSCLENSMDRGAWRATVHGVARVRHDLRD